MTSTRRIRVPWMAIALVLSAGVLGYFPGLWSRFYSSGLDLRGFLLLALPGLFCLFLAAGALSDSTRELSLEALRKLGTSRGRAPLVASWLAGGVLVWTALVWASLPMHSRSYNDLGVQLLQEGLLAESERQLRRAVQLDPSNGAAHYNLAGLEEELLRVEDAMEHYRFAYSAGVRIAGNNLARLLILRGDEDSAATILQRLRRALPGTSEDTPEVRLAVAKNLAWARVLQGRPREALVLLEEARAIDEERAVLYCLEAEALTAGAQREAARAAWQRCLGLASSEDPEEDSWIGRAQAALAGEGG